MQIVILKLVLLVVNHAHSVMDLTAINVLLALMEISYNNLLVSTPVLMVSMLQIYTIDVYLVIHLV